MARRCPWKPWTPRVARLLRRISDRTDFTDLSLAAYIEQRSGRSVDRSALAHARRGAAPARMELLFAMLEHGDEDDRRVILEAIAEPWGYRVVPVGEDSDPRGVSMRALRMMSVSGRLAAWLQKATADGIIDVEEWAELEALGGELLDSARSLKRMAKSNLKAAS